MVSYTSSGECKVKAIAVSMISIAIYDIAVFHFGLCFVLPSANVYGGRIYTDT